MRNDVGVQNNVITNRLVEGVEHTPLVLTWSQPECAVARFSIFTRSSSCLLQPQFNVCLL